MIKVAYEREYHGDYDKCTFIKIEIKKNVKIKDFNQILRKNRGLSTSDSFNQKNIIIS